MSRECKSWILTDTDNRISAGELETGPRQLGLPEDGRWSIRSSTLQGGLSRGVDIVEIDNGEFHFSVLPTRGMGIWRGEYRGLAVGWDSPVKGPVNPQHVNILERGGLGWITGFDEMMVRCGLASHGAPCKDIVPNNMGVPTEVDLTLHGKIANIPASFVQVEVCPGDRPELAVIGEVYEAALFFPQYRLRTRISTRVGSNAVTIADEVTNLAAVEAELELLYHCNFGSPFLEEGSRLVVPARVVAPRTALDAAEIEECHTYLGPTAGYVERAYWYELFAREDASTAAMLRNASGDRAVVLRFSIEELPAFTQWKNTAALSDGYVTGLEPGTDYPNPRTFEREEGRVKTLAPGETHRSTVTLEVHDSSSAVRAVEDEITAIQQNRETVVHTAPNPHYSPLD